MSWSPTCEAAEVCFDAVDNKFCPGDRVAYLTRGSIHSGKVHKINLNECGQIKTCWITPDEKYKWDARRHSTYVMGPEYEKKGWGNYIYKTRDVVKSTKTQFYDDALITVDKIVKIP